MDLRHRTKVGLELVANMQKSMHLPSNLTLKPCVSFFPIQRLRLLKEFIMWIIYWYNTKHKFQGHPHLVPKYKLLHLIDEACKSDFLRYHDDHSLLLADYWKCKIKNCPRHMAFVETFLGELREEGTIIYSPEGGYMLTLEGIELCNLFDSNCVRYAAIRGFKQVNGSAHELYTWPEWDDKTKTCLEAWLENMPSPYMQNAGEISEYMWTV
jgi:hypothetical protein